MSSMKRALCVALGCMGCTTASQAAMFTLESTLTGGFTSDGDYANSPFFQNYYVGHTALAPAERRNFFIFDLSVIPDSEFVIGARLKLEVPAFPPGYISPDPFEVYHLSGTTFSADEVSDMTLTSDEALDIYESLGTGTLYGEITVSPMDMGADVVIDILPEGVMEIDAAVGGEFALGGRSTSLSFIPPDELIFSFTDVPVMAAFPRLEIFTIPEPSTLSLLGGISLFLGLKFRRVKTVS